MFLWKVWDLFFVLAKDRIYINCFCKSVRPFVLCFCESPRFVFRSRERLNFYNLFLWKFGFNFRFCEKLNFYILFFCKAMLLFVFRFCKSVRLLAFLFKSRSFVSFSLWGKRLWSLALVNVEKICYTFYIR